MDPWYTPIIRELKVAFIRADHQLFDELEAGIKQAAASLRDAHTSLAHALEDNQLEELELMALRLDFLKAQAALRPISSASSIQMDGLARILKALSATGECFVEHEVVTDLRVSPALERIPMSIDFKTRTFGEYCQEVLEARLHDLLAVVREVMPAPPPGPFDESDEDEFSGRRPFTLAASYLEVMAHYGIPGCLYGSESRRENPWASARALGANCDRLAKLVADRTPGLEPVERLRQMEGRITSFIEEVRSAGAPLTVPGRIFSRFRPDRVAEVRAMLNQVSEIQVELDQLLEDWA